MNAAAGRPRIRHAGDTLVLVELEPVISLDVNRRVVALARAVRAARIRGVVDVVPAYASVGVHIDPLRFDPAGLDAVVSHPSDGDDDEAPARVIGIPVCYGGPFGPDLGDVASFAGCSEDDVVARHSEGRYRVYMLGFLPGFAYLGGVDTSIAMPRRSAPRAVVPSGSVGIAGRQTGVYPCESPGGWQLVGRTPVAMFDASSDVPALLAPGDVVRFIAVPHGEWPTAAATVTT